MRRAALLTVAALALAAGCSQGGDEVTVTVDGSASAPTQTASAGTSGPEPEVVGTIATGLEVPWGLAFLPNGDAVVTERDSARVLTISGPDHTVTEVGKIGEAAPEGEGGLLGVAVSPTYDRDHTLYFYVSSADDNRIVTAPLQDGTLGA